MNIISTQYTLKYKSFEIVVSGCKGNNGVHCKGCHSPSTWRFDQGEYYKTKLPNIKNKIKEFSHIIEWIWIYGGEVNDNNLDDLKDLLLQLKTLKKPIVLFTRLDFSELPEFELDLCDYIKFGEYKEELKLNNNIWYGIKLATSNQKIYKKGLDY